MCGTGCEVSACACDSRAVCRRGIFAAGGDNQSPVGDFPIALCRAYAGALRALSWGGGLARRGCPLGVNTSKPNFATKAILEHFKLDKLFGSAVVAGGDCDEKKPSAKPLLECAARLGHTLTPADWMVGDSWTDLDCAANAGVKGAFCAYGFGSLGESSYALRMESFADLLSVV